MVKPLTPFEVMLPMQPSATKYVASGSFDVKLTTHWLEAAKVQEPRRFQALVLVCEIPRVWRRLVPVAEATAKARPLEKVAEATLIVPSPLSSPVGAPACHPPLRPIRRYV